MRFAQSLPAGNRDLNLPGLVYGTAGKDTDGDLFQKEKAIFAGCRRARVYKQSCSDVILPLFLSHPPAKVPTPSFLPVINPSLFRMHSPSPEDVEWQIWPLA